MKKQVIEREAVIKKQEYVLKIIKSHVANHHPASSTMIQIFDRMRPHDGDGVPASAPTFSYIYRTLPKAPFTTEDECKARYPNVQFFLKEHYKTFRGGEEYSIARAAFYGNEAKGKEKAKQGPLYYLEEADGRRASVAKAEAVRAASHAIVKQWRLNGLTVPTQWRYVGIDMKSDFVARLCEAEPLLFLSDGLWKATQVALDYYSGYFKKRGTSEDESESKKRVKVEKEDSVELTLSVPYSCRAGTPTSQSSSIDPRSVSPAPSSPLPPSPTPSLSQPSPVCSPVIPQAPPPSPSEGPSPALSTLALQSGRLELDTLVNTPLPPAQHSSIAPAAASMVIPPDVTSTTTRDVNVAQSTVEVPVLALIPASSPPTMPICDEASNIAGMDDIDVQTGTTSALQDRAVSVESNGPAATTPKDAHVEINTTEKVNLASSEDVVVSSVAGKVPIKVNLQCFYLLIRSFVL